MVRTAVRNEGSTISTQTGRADRSPVDLEQAAAFSSRGHGRSVPGPRSARCDCFVLSLRLQRRGHCLGSRRARAAGRPKHAAANQACRTKLANMHRNRSSTCKRCIDIKPRRSLLPQRYASCSSGLQSAILTRIP
eukprot:2609068-Pleurochrysis_carterae.AAC.1